MGLQREDYLKLFNQIDFDKIKDHPNILIAASFWDNDRYEAARTFYRFMRAIDDLIDNHKSSHLRFSEDEKKQLLGDVQQWLEVIRTTAKENSLYQDLIDTITRFKIPLWPLEAFAKSMIYDIHNDGFNTLQHFLDYASGASVAPASIFVHLCGIREGNGQYLPPLFDVREAAIPCAVFSYLVHIIRDFQKDQFNNLNYFADDILGKNGLDRKDLRKIAENNDVPDGFRKVIKEYHDLADQYRGKTRNMIETLWPLLGPRYQLSLEVIFNLYLMVFERIDPEAGRFTTEELNPTTDEMRSRVLETVKKFREGV
ncbi:MAG: squalene/phytoene synthase family protein [Bacteroidales bacterium]|nr:squalene/phytoene synthase family protein [Bacteroidales bacterium]